LKTPNNTNTTRVSFWETLSDLKDLINSVRSQNVSSKSKESKTWNPFFTFHSSIGILFFFEIRDFRPF